ncbi:putative baseplate assembly protein [Nonomuraea sp. NPDC050153]|uniref:putative baseplate assembly protein n=1 Tax=Nonomuraea sp. NPDC050153 TaxID=3364359 RepID=UPI0037A94662
MTAAWWTPETRPEEAAAEAAIHTAGAAPELLDATAAAVRRAVRDRIPAYTPDWTNQRAGDPGVALTSLLGDLFQPVLERANRLPEKLLVEQLRIAGIGISPATAARTVLQIQVVDTAPAPVVVPEGFQAAAATADGNGRVVFETERTVVVTPTRLTEAHVQIQRLTSSADAGALTAGTARVRPFGDRPAPGMSFWLGLDTPVRPTPSLSLQIVVTDPAGLPPAAARGGTPPPPELPPPVLRWDVLAGSRLIPAAVLLDETGGLQRSGVIELGLPDGWDPATSAELRSRLPLRWLRAQLVHGGYRRPPVLAAVRPNAVAAVAARTIAGEALERLPRRGPGGTVMRVAQTPVLPDSLVIEVDAQALDPFGLDDTGGPTRWQEVASLAGMGPDRRVFTVDHAQGLVTFGDGIEGAAVPDGFRNVRAVRYRIGGGPGGAIAAGTRLSALTAVPFVTGAISPDAATGGAPAEPVDDAVRRGPARIRSRGRAVTVADYASLALRAEGAQIVRAHAAAGFHPDVPGPPVPGLVGVLIVPARRDQRPPLPVLGELDAVARHLTEQVAPAGVQVIVGSPHYERIRVEGRIVADPDADLGAVVRDAIAVVDAYLDPVTGGDDGHGWPFGAPVRHAALVRRLLVATPGLRAVSSLNLVADGRRLAPCADHPVAPHGLPYPDTHELVPVPGRV